MRSCKDVLALALAAVTIVLLAAPVAVQASIVASNGVSNASSLFPEETIQLTESMLDGLVAHAPLDSNLSDYASIFGFPNTSAPVAKLKRAPGDCKTYAGDSSWPSALLWHAFDFLLGGALLEVPPIASPCYSNWDNYDEAYCTYLEDEFTSSFVHMDHPTSIMSPFYQGATCMPTEGEPANCTLGGFPYYVVNVTNVAQIQLAVNMARTLDLRIVIKNTGHDFAGKSAGEGALGIWTHNLKSLEYQPDYVSGTYSGVAFKMGAGVQSYELYEAADTYGVTVVAGEGETVGVAGGYIQGGGHSPLSSVYGLASDHVLAYQVVTADGAFLTCSDDEHADLFWALRGGGGSTFGVVTSVTVKAWPEMGASVSSFALATGDDLPPETFWEAMRLFWAHFLDFADAGAYGYFRVYATGEDAYYFGMTPFFTPGLGAAEHVALLQPWLDELAALNVSLAVNATHHDGFYGAWASSFPLETVGLDAGRIASRLFPRANWEDAALMEATWAAVRNTTEHGYYFTGFNMKTELRAGNTDNSANPAWRGSVLHAITAVAWTDPAPAGEIVALSQGMTFGCVDQWRAVTNGSGAYLGEVSCYFLCRGRRAARC